MRAKFEKFGLITVGAILGVMLSLNYSAIAEKDSNNRVLPLEDLRAFAEVFGKIKSDYVEPIEDKKLISGAINGMLSSLDPHSAFLDDDVGDDALGLDRAAARRVVACRGQLDRGAVVHRQDGLHRALAEALRAQHDGPLVILQGAGDDFGSRSRATID